MNIEMHFSLLFSFSKEKFQDQLFLIYQRILSQASTVQRLFSKCPVLFQFSVPDECYWYYLTLQDDFNVFLVDYLQFAQAIFATF